MCDTSCFSTATMVAWMRISVVLYICTLPVLIWISVSLLNSLSTLPPFFAHAWETFSCSCFAVSCRTSNFMNNCTLEIIFQPWLQINFCLSNCILRGPLSVVSYYHHLKVFLATIWAKWYGQTWVICMCIPVIVLLCSHCKFFLSNLTSCTCMSCSVGFHQFEYFCKNKYFVK